MTIITAFQGKVLLLEYEDGRRELVDYFGRLLHQLPEVPDDCIDNINHALGDLP